MEKQKTMSLFVSPSYPSFQGTKVNAHCPQTCPIRRRNKAFNARASLSKSEIPPAERNETEPSVEPGFAESNITEGSDIAELEGISEADVEESNDWYEVIESVSKPDTGAKPFKEGDPTRLPESNDGVLDLGALDGMGREMLIDASYDHVVDIDIEKGGILDVEDEDNNDLFCGVGLDALVENEQIIHNLREELKIETATHVQLAGIPRVSERRDIVIQSHTGTGKTLAFLLPLLDNIDTDSFHVQGIIVAPTRELAMQIFRECERLCEGTEIRSISLIGGANPARQVDKLRRTRPHIVVGTPGRVAEMEEHRELRVSGAKALVVDEVDQCMQPAFAEDVVYLLKAAPRKIQKVLVSATSDVDSVRAFAGQYLHKPILLRVGGAQRLPKNITHWFCVVPARMRIELLRKLMHTSPAPARAIAFVDDPRRVDIVVERLYQMKIVAGALRGNAYKLERAEVLSAFRKGRVQLLVTTEVAARGLDIPEITHVFNMDLPTDGDHYVHRAGRCGRAGRVGTVVSIATADTAFVMGRLEKELNVPIRRMEPRGGRYGEVIQRTRERNEGKTLKSEDRRKVGDGPHKEKVVTRTGTRQSDNSNAVEEAGDLSQTWNGKPIDEVLKLWQEEARELDPKFDDDDDDEEDRTNREAKKKVKGKKKVKAEKKVRVKVRARDLKNKGKPKRRVEGDVSSKSTLGDSKPEVERLAEDKNKPPKPTTSYKPAAASARKAPRDLRLRAKMNGWVGNREDPK